MQRLIVSASVAFILGVVLGRNLTQPIQVEPAELGQCRVVSIFPKGDLKDFRNYQAQVMITGTTRSFFLDVSPQIAEVHLTGSANPLPKK